MTHEDLWEERGVSRGKGVITYSLAAMAVGLLRAADMLDKHVSGATQNQQIKEYLTSAEEIKTALNKYTWNKEAGSIPRQFGVKKSDYTIDASLAGLVWPFNIGFSNDHLIKTVERIERELVSEKGVHRYIRLGCTISFVTKFSDFE